MQLDNLQVTEFEYQVIKTVWSATNLKAKVNLLYTTVCKNNFILWSVAQSCDFTSVILGWPAQSQAWSVGDLFPSQPSFFR